MMLRYLPAALAVLSAALLPWSGARAQGDIEDVYAALLAAVPAPLVLRAENAGFSGSSRTIVLEGVYLGPAEPTAGVPVLRAAKATIREPAIQAQPLSLLTAGQIELRQVEVVPASGVGTAQIAELTLSEVVLPFDSLSYLFDTDPDEDEIEDRDEREAAAAARDVLVLLMADTIGASQISVHDIRTFEPRDGENRLTARIGLFQLDGIAEGQLGDVLIERVQVDDSGRVNLDRLNLRTIAFGRLLHRFLDPEPEAAEDAEEEEPTTVERLAEIDPGLEMIEITGLAVDSREGVPLLRLERAALDDVRRDLGFPTSFSAQLSGLVLPVASFDDDEAEAALAEMGYDTVALSATFEAGYQPDQERLALSALRIDARNMVLLEASASIVRFDLVQILDQLERMARTGVPPIPALAIEGFSVSLDDRSLITQLMNWLAVRDGSTREAVAAGVGTALDEQLSAFGLRGVVRDQVTGALVDFLSGGSSFVMRAEPAEPVPLVELGLGLLANPQAMLDRLSFVVEAQ